MKELARIIKEVERLLAGAVCILVSIAAWIVIRSPIKLYQKLEKVFQFEQIKQQKTRKGA